jgi:subtilisin family serine protease
LEVDKDQLDQLARSGLIANVQEDVLYETTLSTSGPKIQGPKAQSLGALGAGQAVAVIDTGVERNHPFFDAERIVGEACFSSRSIANGTESVCPEGRSFAYGPNAAAPCKDARGCEHGTHVAGIAAGKLGVAPKARIVPIQVFSKFGPRVFSYQSDQIRALQYVLEHASEFNITAVNMSLGRAIKPAGASTPCDTDAAHGYLATLIEDLNEQGVATIIAAGNNKYTRGVGDPACVSSAIAVSSTTVDDQISDFSDVGPTVKLAAPGSNICSSIPGGQFAKLSGTSMAAPQVAGAFVAIKSVVPTKSTRAILTALQATGTLVRDQRDPNGLDVRRINIADAIQMLAGGSVRTTSYVAPRKPTGWCN